MNAKTTICPRCGGVAQYVAHPDGYLLDTYFPSGGPTLGQDRWPTRVRLAPFWACSSCEWCQECAYARMEKP